MLTAKLRRTTILTATIPPIAVVALLLIGTPARASCWSASHAGICGSFVGQSGLELDLCEDNPGDCEKQGYRPIDVGSSESSEPSRAVDNAPVSGSAPHRERALHRRSIDGSSDSASGGIILIVVIIGCICLVAAGLAPAFGLDAGTAVLASLVGLFFGLAGGGNPRRRRW